jgi:hypothetical protein
MSVHKTSKPNVPVLHEAKKRSVPVRYGVPRIDETEATKQALEYASRRNKGLLPVSNRLADNESSEVQKQALAYAEGRNRQPSISDHTS